MKISVIIPALNEAGSLKRAIGSIGGSSEVIVADGGSADATEATAHSLNAIVLKTGPGRGLQMDRAAEVANGEVFLFLHADTELPGGWRGLVNDALKKREVIGGAFRLSIDAKGARYRVIEFGAYLRSKLFGIMYGDQALFVRRDAFRKAGGFKNLPLMEDVDCVMRLRGFGRLALLNGSVKTSKRSWQKNGVLAATLRNWLVLMLYLIGVSPKTLYRLYYGTRL
jgi:rSAM/selenodomain-associated transferase 2